MGALYTVPTSAPDGYELIGSSSGTNASLSYSVSVGRIYQEILAYVSSAGGGTPGPGIYAGFNNDAGSTSYSGRGWYVNSAALTNYNSMDNLTGLFLGTSYNGFRNTAVLRGSTGFLSGARRMFQVKASYISAAGVMMYLETANVWNNSADPISTMQIFGSTAAAIYYDILVYGKR